jgi:hypothetical protein
LRDNPLLGHRGTAQLGDLPAVSHDDDPIAQIREIAILSAAKQDRGTVRRGGLDLPKMPRREPMSTPCVGSCSNRVVGFVWNHFASSAFC